MQSSSLFLSPSLISCCQVASSALPPVSLPRVGDPVVCISRSPLCLSLCRGLELCAASVYEWNPFKPEPLAAYLTPPFFAFASYHSIFHDFHEWTCERLVAVVASVVALEQLVMERSSLHGSLHSIQWRCQIGSPPTPLPATHYCQPQSQTPLVSIEWANWSSN